MGIIVDVNLLYKGELECLKIIVDKYPSLISFRGKYKIALGIFIEIWYSRNRTYIRYERMIFMIFVGGIHGVGKTYFCNMIKEILGIKNYSAS